MSKVEIKLDDELLALVDERAAASGDQRDDVIAEAVRRQLEGGRLREILASARARSGLAEEEAMLLAVAEQKATVPSVPLAETWDDPPEPPAVSPDPDDDYLIALARCGRARLWRS